MPAFLTHRAAGERVYNQLGKAMVPHKKAFYLGCQGPDMLYFRNYQPWRSARDNLLLGLEMHSEKVRELWTNALEFVRQYASWDKDELVSYIFGFITHYAIDKNAHGFVYGKAGKDTERHNEIEFMWDSYSAKEQWDIEPEQFDIYSEVMYEKLCDGICGWYQAAAREVYSRDIPAKLVRQAQKHLAKAKTALANIHLPGKLLIRMVSRALGFNVGAMQYPKQRDEVCFTGEEYRCMQDMLSKGVNEACDMIGFAFDYIRGKDAAELPAWFGDKDFTGNTA